nr:hypothetical protein OG409_18270 [Streptomyces sp. NBC_00974]
MLRSRKLRPGVALNQTSRYSDDVWQLTPAMLKEHERAFILNFLAVPDRFRPAAKRQFYCLLTAEAPVGEEPVGIHTVRSYFGKIKALMLWLDKHWPPDKSTLGELTPQDLDDYNRHLLATYPHSPSRRSSHRSTIRAFWRWRTRLGRDALRFDPLRIEGWSASAAPRRGENATDRLPEPVLGPLLVWAFRFIDEFSADILRADQCRQRTPLGRGRATYKRRKGAIESRLRRMLEEHLTQKRPLPGHEGHPNIEHIARTLGCGHASVDRYAHLIADTAAVVGIAPFSHFNTAVTGRLDGEPWIDGIATLPRASTGLVNLQRHLQSACYIAIAFLSGMRDSEVKHLRRDCLRVQRDENGHPYRWKVHSLAFKGERDAAGVPATWIVGEPVARAIKVMEALQRPEVDYLFSPLGQAAQKTIFAAMTSQTTNQQLNRFVAWINDYCADQCRPDAIPKVNKMVLHLKTSLFRRTLAWFVARHPGGVIAGALQYRHHSIQMFEGYAGTSASGFRAEVESEQALSRGAFYTERIEAHEHTDFKGPSAEEAATRLQDFGERAQFQGQLALDRNRLQRIMKRHDPGVYPGTYITCVHDPAKALCEKARRGRGEGLPEHGGCLPLACRNVALTAENTQAWQRELDRIERRLMARPLLPPLVAHRLNERRAEIAEFLTSNGIPVIAP